MTDHFQKKLLVVISEAVLERQLIELARGAGALGYTVHDVRGAGQHDEREGSWEADRTIEMKIVCAADVADRIADAVVTRFGNHYGLTLFIADVAVLRPQKY
jgi:nitrogen regulatory protein P-II 2